MHNFHSFTLPTLCLLLTISLVQVSCFLPINIPRVSQEALGRSTVSASRKSGMQKLKVPMKAASSTLGDRPLWQLSCAELSECLHRAEWQADQNSGHFDLTAQEEEFLPVDFFKARRDLVGKSQQNNAAFLNAVSKYVEDWDQERCMEHECVMKVKVFQAALGKDYYVSLSAVMMHLLRDWGSECTQTVLEGAYRPILEQLQRYKPVKTDEKAPSVFVPGSGLSRLPFELMMAGYDVESNENSRIFVTFSDYLFNHCTKKMKTSPMAHMFDENYELRDQFFNTEVPSPLPCPAARMEGRHFTMTMGDMVEIYKEGGQGHRKFDCVVTCFFIDTADDLISYIKTIDQLLEEGGVWINFGPLNYQPKLKLKIVWEEMRALWQHLGYEFVQDDRVEHCYNIKNGIRLHTERYDVVFSTAVKRTSDV